MNLNFAKASAEISDKFNPFLQINQKNSNKEIANSKINKIENLKSFANPYQKNSFVFAQKKFHQNSFNKFPINNELKTLEILNEEKVENNINNYNFNENERLENKLFQKNNLSSNQDNESYSNTNILNNNNPNRSINESNFIDNKENSSLKSNTNFIADNINLDLNRNFNKKYDENFLNNKNENDKNVLSKNNFSGLNFLKMDRNKIENSEKNRVENVANNNQNFGLSQLHMSQLNISKQKNNTTFKYEFKTEQKENSHDDCNNNNENQNENSNFFNNYKNNKLILCDPFENKPLKTKQKFNSLQVTTCENNSCYNHAENKHENFKELKKNIFLQKEYLNKELNNISKKVIDFKLKEESSNEQFKNDKNNDNKDLTNKDFSKFGEFKNTNTEISVPFPNLNQTKKQMNNIACKNNKNLFSDLLVMNKLKNNEFSKNQITINSGISSKNYTTRDNSISSYNETCLNDNLNKEKTILPCKEKTIFPCKEKENKLENLNDDSTPNIKNNEKDKINNEETKKASLLTNNDSKKDAGIDNQTIKILKIKNQKVNNLTIEKNKDNVIYMSLLKKKKVLMHISNSVKKYADHTQDFFLDIENQNQNFYNALSYYKDFEINKLNQTEKNMLSGKQQMNTDKRKYWGRFNQINGEKVESYRVYRDDDLSIPPELQSKVHIRPDNEKFDEDLSSSDEIIHIAKIHYNSQFNILRAKNFNFFQCNNLKYTQGLYWDD